MADHLNADRESQMELERVSAMIDAYNDQLDALNQSLEAINAQNENDDVSRQIEEYQEKCTKDPASIPAEDALDTITRLQNTLKIVRRRNQLLARENATQEKLLCDRSKVLTKAMNEHDTIVDKTGWHEQISVDLEGQEQRNLDINQMRTIETMAQKELRAAQVVQKKKEKQILELEALKEQCVENDAKLNNVYNDIRVKQRDCRELEMRLEQMRKESEKNDRALTVLESQSGSLSLSYMESDKDFLREAVVEMKGRCRHQDEVVKAQLTRQHQLQARLDTIMRSLREMKLFKEYERNVSKSALVPSVSREEPEDALMVIPEEESIPIHTYRLIYKNNEAMRTNVARKNMLVLEKEGVIQALEANLSKYTDSLNMTSKQQDDLKRNKEMEMDELMDELQQQHQSYLRQLEQIMQENNQLKRKIQRNAPPRSAIKNR